MSQLQAEYVKRGFWTNGENGSIMGQTITTDTRTGSLVVALLAVLTTFGLGHFWNILMFTYHQIRAHSRPSDGYFYQQQAPLRTLPPPNAITSNRIKLWWTWRDKADRAFACAWLLALVSVVLTAATVAVGVFVSYVVSNTDIEVLVDSLLCCPFDLDLYNNQTVGGFDLAQYDAELRTLSRDYSQNCYQNMGILPTQCSTYVRPSVNFTRTHEACPFSNICGNVAQPGVVIDSGLVDVNQAFGLDLQPRDNVKLRRKNTCAFLETGGRYSVDMWTYESPRSQKRWEEIFKLYYGKHMDWPSNHTFIASLMTANYSYEYDVL
jgi:hypothetical protein